MRRAIISIILLFSLISVTSTTVTAPIGDAQPLSLDPLSTNDMLISNIMRSGSSVPIAQQLHRTFANQLTTISNSFALLDTHQSTIDLSPYQIPGWTLSSVIIDVENITAISEREVVGSNTTLFATINFAIDEPGGPTSDVYINQLAQGFYNMGHDGQLQNISLLYMSPSYDPPNHQYAYFDIRSDYQDGNTNMVSSVQLEPVGLSPTWANITEQVVLNASTVYYAMINGTKLLDVSDSYPEIRWFYENVPEAYLTARYSTEFSSWGYPSYEAILNYTYIPWNKTSNSALVYSNPSSIDTRVDVTPVSGSSWVLSSANNITSFQIDTNQSVNLYYSLTLCYTDDNIGNTSWGADVSGNPIEWNVTTDLTFPAVSNVVARGIDIMNIPLDWIGTGLYLGPVPAGAYSKSGTNVTCTGLSDGYWTYTSNAPNYVVNLSLLDTSDNSTIPYKVANTVTIDANATIEDDGGTPQTGGTANLSVLQSSTLIYSPTEIPAISGTAIFQWDISSTTNGNATHSVEVYWESTDRLEAGYMTQEVFVYHSTTLVADDLSIDAFTEDSFDIGVNFNKISPAQGLDPPTASVTYSIGSTINASLTPSTGGRWTASIDTTGMTNGMHILTVYAEGFALENHSLVIMVDLNHQTWALNWSWSNTNDINYTESTILSITYMRLDNTSLSGATVNVTFEGQTYNMTWDILTETYWIELTGENFSGSGTYALNVSAWVAGYQAQYNDTIMITIRSETTGVTFNVEYIPATLNISYIESMTVLVTYNFNSNPIHDSTVVRITFNGTMDVFLDFNSTSDKWETTLLGINYLGTWDIFVEATSAGYDSKNETQLFIVREDIPILSSSWVDNSATTDYATIESLTLTLTDSSGTPIPDANVSFWAFGVNYELLSGAGGQYVFNINPADVRGIESFTVYVNRIGFTLIQMNLNLTVEATTTIDVIHISSEYEEWNLTVTVTYEDSVYNTPITDALVTMTLDGKVYVLDYIAGAYTIEITLEAPPGSHIIDVTASALYAVTATSQTDFTVIAKEHVYLEITFDGDLVAGQFMEIRATLRSNDTDEPIQGEAIRFQVYVYFDNGTVIQYSDGTMTDTTNTEGIATLGFEVPFGNIDRLTARAIYEGSRTRWNAELLEETGVEVSPLSLLLAFFLSDVGLLMIISIALLGIVAAGYNRGVKPKKRAARKGLENQLQMFKDLETVQHFMAVYLDRGTCVFYHPFTEERIQPDLISGFIAAVTSVYGEIKGDGVRGTLEEIQYHGLRLNSYSGQYIIGILILGGEMTPLLRERLQFFVELFENQYDQDLDGWTGVIDCFDPEWVVSTLNSAFNYAWHLPHRFGPTQKVSKMDARILDYIGAVRDDRSEFYIKDLLTPLAEMLDKTESQILDRLLILQDKGVIVPIGIQTILQRQGLALANGTEELPKPIEPETIEELEYELPEEPVEMIEEKVEEVEKPSEVDEMEAFVQDVESILKAEAEK
ncbi:MAG: hypothetical protein ACFFEE_08455, partial [Candidatus Thorarchaeota archaeon]